MPVIHVFHPDVAKPVQAILRTMCHQVAQAMDLPIAKVWGLWHTVEAARIYRWDDVTARDEVNTDNSGPIVRVFCRRSHSRARVAAAMHSLRASLARELECSLNAVFVQVVRVDDEEVLNVS